MKNLLGVLASAVFVVIGCVTMKDAWQAKEDFWALRKKGVETTGEIVMATSTKSESKRRFELTVRYGPTAKPVQQLFGVPEDLYRTHATPPPPQIVNGMVLPWPDDLVTQKKIRVRYLPEQPLTAMLVGVEPDYESFLYLSAFLLLVAIGVFFYNLLGANRFSRGGI